jgi:hypothetical protein
MDVMTKLDRYGEEARVKITSDTVRHVLEASLESDEPDEILRILKEYEGRLLTVRILGKLPGGPERWRLFHHIGMTHLETWEYRQSQGNRGMHFLLAYTEKSVIVDTKFLVEQNPAYYVGRIKRNAERKAMLANLAICEVFAARMDAVRVAREALREAEGAMGEFTDGQHRAGPVMNFSADRYDWEAIVGEDEE